MVSEQWFKQILADLSLVAQLSHLSLVAHPKLEMLDLKRPNLLGGISHGREERRIPRSGATGLSNR